MRTYLVTGGAGFIGSNYIHYMLKKYGEEIKELWESHYEKHGMDISEHISFPMMALITLTDNRRSAHV